MNRNLNPIEFARSVSEKVECERGGEMTNCGVVAHTLDNESGGNLRFTRGVRRATDDEGDYAAEHAWNTLPDGSILDATANQFGEERVKHVPIWDARQEDYQQARDIDPDTGETGESAVNDFLMPTRLSGWGEGDQPEYERVW